jgi:hypothetical protein
LCLFVWVGSWFVKINQLPFFFQITEWMKVKLKYSKNRCRNTRLSIWDTKLTHFGYIVPFCFQIAYTFASQSKEIAINDFKKNHFDKIVFVFICLGWKLVCENKPTPFFLSNSRMDESEIKVP